MKNEKKNHNACSSENCFYYYVVRTLMSINTFVVTSQYTHDVNCTVFSDHKSINYVNKLCHPRGPCSHSSTLHQPLLIT